jgi:hypothetical protein
MIGLRRRPTAMIDLENRQDVTPLCPYCERELARVWFRELKGLGISHRKGLFMG